jgi:hypothetical protein
VALAEVGDGAAAVIVETLLKKIYEIEGTGLDGAAKSGILTGESLRSGSAKPAANAGNAVSRCDVAGIS